MMTLNFVEKVVLAAGLTSMISLNCKDLYAVGAYSKTERKIHEDISCFVTKMTRIWAEKMFDDMCRNKNVITEDAYILFNNILQDIGYNEKPEFVDVYVSEELTDLIENRTTELDTIRMYHRHLNPDPEGYFYPPHPEEIEKLLEFQENFYRHNRKLTEVVTDGRGLWEWNIDDKVMQTLCSDEMHRKKIIRSMIRAIENEYSVIYNELTARGINDERMWSTQESINRYIDALDKVGITLKFTPSEELQKRYLQNIILFF